MRARTGSGKTAAFALPTLNKILLHKEEEQQEGRGSGKKAGVLAVVCLQYDNRPRLLKLIILILLILHAPHSQILVPTKELCAQTYRCFWDLSYYCRDIVSVQALVGENMSAQQALLRDFPDVLIATPSRLLTHLKAGNIRLKDSVQTLGK